jgi:protein TonB
MPDFDDLIFEFRNKDYGAYELRKGYFSALITGILIASLLGCCAVIIPFVLKTPDDHVIAGGRRYMYVNMDVLEPIREEIYVPPAPPLPEPAKAQEIVKYIPPEVVDTIIPLEMTTISTDEILAHAGDNQEGVNSGPGYGDELLSGDVGIMSSDEPYILVEEMPSFRGGDINRFREWIQKRIIYPQDALDKKIQGRVLLTFIVESDGSVSNVTVVKGVDPLIDNEAVKAIEGSPGWSPGKQRGKPVRIRYIIPIIFGSLK